MSKWKHRAKQLQVIRCSKGNGSPVQIWLERLNALGLAPEVITLAKVPIAQGQARKAIWVRLLLGDGRCLYNAQLGSRRKPTLYVKQLQERIIRERNPKKRWQRALSTLRQNYQREIGQRKQRLAQQPV